MIELKASGLPILMDDEYTLHFEGGLSLDSSGGKKAGAMRGLLMDESNLNDDEPYYSFYRDIVFEKDRALFTKYDYRYDITVICPGTVGGEYKKTSGHYHGPIAGQEETYPEVYEVLLGRACFFFQKVKEFAPDGAPRIEEMKAVFVDESQAIIIPPHYAHCSVNAGDGPLAFSNIAVVSCPLDYTPVKNLHGMAAYLIKGEKGPEVVKNPHYQNPPAAQVVTPKENPALGITFGQPVYHEFIQAPEKFDYLLYPGRYGDQLEALTRP